MADTYRALKQMEAAAELLACAFDNLCGTGGAFLGSKVALDRAAHGLASALIAIKDDMRNQNERGEL